MKRFLSVFACVILLTAVCAFPVVVADDSTDININDMIFLHSEKKLRKSSLPWFFYGNGVGDLSSDFDKFLSVILFNSSLDRSLITLANVQSWRAMIFLDEQLKNDYTFSNSASEFILYYAQKPDFISVGFTPSFVRQLNSYYKSFCDSIGVDSSLYSLNILSISTNIDGWYSSYSSMVYYFKESTILGNAIFPYSAFLVSRSAYESESSSGLSSFWSGLLNVVDISSMTSWLPSAISTQFIIYFSSFFALVSILIAIKILHG